MTPEEIAQVTASVLGALQAQQAPTNVGQTTPAPTTNVVDCGRCANKHNGRHNEGCPNKPTNVGQTTAQATFVAPADVLSRRTFTLTKVKVGVNTEKWELSDDANKTWIVMTLPKGSGLPDVFNLAVS